MEAVKETLTKIKDILQKHSDFLDDNPDLLDSIYNRWILIFSIYT